MKAKVYFYVCAFLLSINLNAQYTKSYPVVSGNDDIEQNLKSKYLNFTSTDLELQGKDGTTLQDVFIRFQNITLPSDAVITSAYINFTPKAASSTPTQVRIYGQVGSSAVYANPASSVSNRKYTTRSVTWNTPSSVTIDDIYSTPDLKDLLKDMFPKGINGVSVGFKLVGNKYGAFKAYSYNGGSSYAPILVINYESKTGGVNDNAPKVVFGPYLQMGGPNSVLLRWRTDRPCDSKIVLGDSFNNYNGNTFYDPKVVKEHELTITGLTPNTQYYYSVESSNFILDRSSNSYIRTAPVSSSNLNQKIRVAAFGDCGSGTSNQTAALNAYLNHTKDQPTDVWLLLGDNAYDNGTDAEFENNFFKMYQNTLLKNTYLYPCLGNHDYANNSSRQADHAISYLKLFTLPENGELGGVPSEKEEYYSFNYGNIHFVSLDSYGYDVGTKLRFYETASKQMEWLKKDLSQNILPWVVVFFHHPPYTRGTHNSDLENDLVRIREKLTGVLEYYGVDMVVNGHSHNYERSYALRNHRGPSSTFDKQVHAVQNATTGANNGTANSVPYIFPKGKYNHGSVYVVSGSAGKTGTVKDKTLHPVMVTNNLTETGIFTFDVEGNTLNAKFITRNGVVGDQFTITKENRTQPLEVVNEYILISPYNDAANFFPKNTVNTISHYMFLQGIFDGYKQDNYFRFKDVYIPQDAVVTEAYLTFVTTSASKNQSTTINIYGEALDSAPYYEKPLWNRPVTKNSVTWVTPSNIAGDVKCSSPNLKDIVQEMIATQNYDATLGFKLVGNKLGKLHVYSYNKSSKNAARLTIKYTTNGLAQHKTVLNSALETYSSEEDMEVSLKAASTDQIEDLLINNEPIVKISPNPATDNITLSIANSDAKVAKVSIFSSEGRENKRITFPLESVAETKQSIDLNGMQPGIYVIKVNLNDQVITEKLIVK